MNIFVEIVGLGLLAAFFSLSIEEGWDCAKNGGWGLLVALIFMIIATPYFAKAISIRSRDIVENRKSISKETDRYAGNYTIIVSVSMLSGALVSLLTGWGRGPAFLISMTLIVASAIFLGMGVYTRKRAPARNRAYKPDQESPYPHPSHSTTPQSSQPIVHCPQCGNAYPPDAHFCPACGATLDGDQKRKRCPICGAQGAPGQLFCENCGAMLQ